MAAKVISQQSHSDEGASNIAKNDGEAPAKRVRLASPEAELVKQQSADESSEAKPLTPEHIFKNLRLRRIVRENHNSTVAQIALMFYRPGDVGLDGHGMGGMSAYERAFDKRGGALRDSEDSSNLFCATGHTQANVYDNENCGDHLDIMSHYQLPSDTTAVFRTCCWVRCPGDALFALAGEDKLVHIISLAWTREIRVLRGHTDSIIDLQPHPTNNRLIASVSSDQTIRLWSVQTGACLCIYNTNASAARFHPDGKLLFIGSPSGEVTQWSVPDYTDDLADPIQLTQSDCTQIVPGKRSTGSSIDCIRFAGSNLLVKNTSGRIEHWSLQNLSMIRTFNVRHHGVNISRFDVSFDDKYLCVGNGRGEAYIFCIDSGKTVGYLKHKRSVRPVTCCLFTRDCRSVIYAGEGGFIWRYDYVDDETLAEWTKHDDSTTEESSVE
ncbi:hypothetical protein GGI25_003464 [Coemansia spiralis]|uniref:WD40 repeat-like protein n=2 Tax=Coemansia TaxID=4863 RepID=A0A9W8G1Y5_9FUNG|nr:WD40-repeat-containing domain protein [Coemansia spiralis]KAJ1991481.1 hypothetical protein EDC05_003405 [Coemansia umbellata]KAJ2621565.1 hypothetical protein GGI26_004028 [Coemansia sp. RSA 1358]KAJ2676712.1 hypothetical protein GGI25_003464 [Coemansia spiralis]